MPAISKKLRAAPLSDKDDCPVCGSTVADAAETAAGAESWVCTLQSHTPQVPLTLVNALAEASPPAEGGGAGPLGGSLPSGPPMRLFSYTCSAAYEARPVDIGLGKEQCVVLTLWRAQMDEGGLHAFVEATHHQRLAFAPPASLVTWGDVLALVETSGCTGRGAVMGALYWDVRLLQSETSPQGGLRWFLVTPPLLTTRERALFLATDVDVLFRYFDTPLLYVCLEPSPAVDASPVDTTPAAGLMSRSSLPTPAAPPRRVERPCAGEMDVSTASYPPRRLADSLHRAAEPEAVETEPCTSPAPATAVGRAAPVPCEWARRSFGCQLGEWQQLQAVLRPRIEGRVPAQALEILRAELRAWTARPTAEWNGAWIMSLRELACDVMLDAAGYAAVRGGGQATTAPLPRPPSSHLRVVGRYLRQCERLARQTVRVVRTILLAAEEREGATARRRSAESRRSAFPFALQRVLLLALLLRGLRHLSLVEATCHNAAGQERVMAAAVDAADRLAEALRALGPLHPEWSPLAPVLLLTSLSLLEVARYLPSAGAHACSLASVAVETLRGWQAITRDPRWSPLCFEDLLAAIEAAAHPSDGAGLAEHLARLRSELGVQNPPALEDGDGLATMGRSSTAASLGLDSADCPPCIGYCQRQLWSLAALDQLYQHGVRQLGRICSVTAWTCSRAAIPGGSPWS